MSSHIVLVVIYAFLDRNIAYWDGPLRTSVRIPRSPEGLLLVTVPTKDVALRARAEHTHYYRHMRLIEHKHKYAMGKVQQCP